MKDSRPYVAPVRRTPRRGRSGKAPVFTVMILFLMCVGAFVYYYRAIAPVEQNEGAAAPSAREDSDKKEDVQDHSEEKRGSQTVRKAEVQDRRDTIREPVPGWVAITDRWGREVTKFRAAMFGEGWLALPSRACLAGNTWEFFPDSGGKGKISGGLWVYGDSAGLWRLEKPVDAAKGPELGLWNEKEPVAWSSLESDRAYPFVKLEARGKDGFFVAAALPDVTREIGVFMQDGAVVGWSFGDWLEEGYMWQGTDGKELQPRTWVSSFYNVTFANGREEKFAMALSMQRDHDGIDQLTAFIDGFRLEPKLDPEDTPWYLLPEEVTGKMRHIVSALLQYGHERTVISMLNSRVLKKIGDAHLVMDVVTAMKSVYGYEEAIREIEDSGLSLVRTQGGSATAVHNMHRELYQEWIQSLVSAGSAGRGLQAFDAARAHFPDDPLIHLLGVELAMLSGDWEEAERLLYMREYPPGLQDRVSLLAIRISEMKGDEGEIVVRFPGMSSRILVNAVINETGYQDFLVDTGASPVTIPSSTVEALGLEVVEGHHGGRRSVSTAGGIVMAREVILDSIEINGWIEYDVRALVLDMPDQPGLGLLGLNYLGRFQVDLKPEEGMLKLTPR